MSGRIDNETLREEIARRAYAKFCDRGCVHGGDMEDWIAAEREVVAEPQQSRARENERADPGTRRKRKRRQ